MAGVDKAKVNCSGIRRGGEVNNPLRGTMLGPIGSEIMAIFRLLSPDEIDKYIVEERADEYQAEGTTKIAAGAEGLSLSSGETHLDDKTGPKKFPKEQQAKIIPLHGRTAEEEDLLSEHKGDEEEQQEQSPQQVQTTSVSSKGSSGLESIGVLSAAQIKQIEQKRLEEEKGKRDSATVFLLKERERMRSAKRKMVEQVAIKSYQVNASVEFYEQTGDEVEEEEDLLSDDLKGILLNKRHF